MNFLMPRDSLDPSAPLIHPVILRLAFPKNCVSYIFIGKRQIQGPLLTLGSVQNAVKFISKWIMYVSLIV